jgi:hypothetical protein
MSQASKDVSLPTFFTPQDLHTVSGTIEVTVTNVNDVWSYSLSGGGVNDGWTASDHQITLKPTSGQPQPVLYNLTFTITGTVFTLASHGLQISVSPETATHAAVAFEGSMMLIHDVTEQHILNLGFVVRFTDSILGVQYHEFDDPTILFDPPQT